MTRAPDHLKVSHGLCRVCGHYGADCTGLTAFEVIDKLEKLTDAQMTASLQRLHSAHARRQPKRAKPRRIWVR